jgi:YD repeat-containing protein
MKTDREKQGLRGAVKSMHVVDMKLEEHDGQIIEKPFFSHAISFDQHGRIIEQINRNPDGSEWRTVNDYSDSGELRATRSYNPFGVLSTDVRYVYDSEGRLIAEQSIAQDGTITTPITYAYDSEGRRLKIQENEFPSEASLMIGIAETNTCVNAGDAKRVETRYNHEGEAVEAKIFNAAGALVSRVEITRDALGNALEELQYTSFNASAGTSCSTEETEALTEEQQAEIAEELARLFSPDAPISKFTHTYDADARLVESKLVMMGMVVNRQTFAYDERGNKSEEMSYGADGNFAGKTIFTHEYDAHGNWTKQLLSTASSWDAEFGLSTPVRVIRRELTFW